MELPPANRKKKSEKKVWGAQIPSLLSFFFPLSRDLPPGNQTLDAACSPLQCAAARGGYEKRVCRICLMSSRHMTRPSPALDSLRCKLVHFPRRATRQFFFPHSSLFLQALSPTCLDSLLLLGGTAQPPSLGDRSTERRSHPSSGGRIQSAHYSWIVESIMTADSEQRCPIFPIPLPLAGLHPPRIPKARAGLRGRA